MVLFHFDLVDTDWHFVVQGQYATFTPVEYCKLMFGKINEYLVPKADFNCKLMFCKINFILPNIYFTKLYSTFTFELTDIHETAALCKFVIQQILWVICINPSQIM